MAKPYVFINDQMQTYYAIKTRMAGNQKFDVLNHHIYNQVVLPGQLVIMGNPNSRLLSDEETELTRLAQKVKRELAQNLAGGDGQLIKNYDLLQKILGYGSLGIGTVTSSWSSHLASIKQTLEDIEGLHKLSLHRGTPIARQEFIIQRRILFSKLDTQLEGVAGWGSGLRKKGSIKKMLGISTKTYLHTGEIQGYAKKIAGVSKASKILKAGTGVGIALNMWSTALEIKEACSTGRSNACRKAHYVEGAKLVSGVAIGAAGGTVGGSLATTLCAVVFAAPSGGASLLGCGIAGGLIGGFGGGVLGEDIGEYAGEMLYEWIPE